MDEYLKTAVTQSLVMAKEHVRRGWLQGSAADLEGRVCAAQALGMSFPEVLTESGFTPTERGYLADRLATWCTDTFIKAIAELYPDWHNSDIPAWNDTKGRTQDEVLEVFDRALKLAERDL